MATTKSSASFAAAPPSKRHIRCDFDFLELLEEDFGIDAYSLNKAFMGVPPASKKQAIHLCEWALRTAGDDPEDAGRALRAWARKHGAGAYSPALLAAPPVA